MLGKTVNVIVDRPLGSVHPKHSNIIYPINYGYVEGIIAPDGEEQDVYLIIDRNMYLRMIILKFDYKHLSFFD